MPATDRRRSILTFALGSGLAAAGLLLIGRAVLLPAALEVAEGATTADPALLRGLPVILGAIEAVLLLSVVPFARRPEGWIAALVAGGTVARAGSGGEFAIIDSVVLLGWGGVLLGLRTVLRSGRAAAVVGALSIASLLWTGPWIESGDDPSGGVELAIRVNPVAAIAYAGHHLDWARERPVTYGQFVGQYYSFRPPDAGDAAWTWLLAGGLGAGLAFGARRRWGW